MLYAIRMLESSNQGCSLYSIEDLEDKFPNEDFKLVEDRNCGLIEVSPEGLEDNASWAEYEISINISTKKINFGVFFAENRKEYEQYYREFDYWGDPNDDDIKYPYEIVEDSLDLSDLSFTEFDKMYDLFDSYEAFIFKSNPDEVICRVE